MKHTIDASGRKLGRIASEAASFLMGKEKPGFVYHAAVGGEVLVVNASKLSVAAKKKRQKKYVRYTGYPGGLREDRLKHVVLKKGYGEALRRAVYGMLPKNKLRAVRMKQLTVQE